MDLPAGTGKPQPKSTKQAAIEGASTEESPQLMTMAVTSSSGTVETSNFAKTDFKSSYSWQAGQSGGSFSWNYPMQTPQVPGGLVPDLALNYSSSSVDGQTANENNQPFWGEGWDYTPGYIERAYTPCDQDEANSPVHTYTKADLCWRLQNARMMLGGQVVELVLGDDGVWRAADDNAAKVELITGGSYTYNYNNEKWRVTTVDGTQYYFGLSQLPGWQAGDRETGSVLGMPVFSNHSQDPCYNVNKANSWCAMAYRWNLDYVVDPHGNTMSYWYYKEHNQTALGGDPNVTTGYDRSGTLRRIEYGTRVGTGAVRETRSGARPPAYIHFVWEDRCLTTSCGTRDRANWPDTPWDLDCSGAPCLNNMGPSFWTTKRLQSVFTKVDYEGTYLPVDDWKFGYEYPATGNNTSPVLWLASVTRKGWDKDLNTYTMPSLLTVGTPMQNRADYDPNASMPNPMKYRITQMRTESGGRVYVEYSPQQDGCKFGDTFPNPDQNTKRCFPLYAGSKDEPMAWGWWHKYVVTKVTERDLVGSSPDVEHHYSYSTDGSDTAVLWAHDDGAKIFSTRGPQKSYSDWRGYPTVTVTTGPAGGQQSQTKTLYFRGLDEGMTDAGETARVANITNSLGEVSADELQFAGYAHEVQTRNGPGGQVISKSITNPVRHRTGTRTMSSSWSWPTKQHSYIVRNARERTLTWLPATSSWRAAETQTDWHPTYGIKNEVSQLGDASTSADDVCTRYGYRFPGSGAPYLIDYPYSVYTRDRACGVAGTTIQSTNFWYDGATTWPSAPTKGDVTKTEEKNDGGHITTSTAEYDQWGRATSVTDAVGRQTTTAYTHIGGLVTQTTVTNPAGHQTVTNIDPLRGLPLTVTDANGKVITGVYDPLGRLTKVWRAGRSTADTPDAEYEYTLQTGSPSYIRTRTLLPNGGQSDQYAIYDGLLRLRQTQAPSGTGSGRAITDMAYDGRGLTVKTSSFFNGASGPSAALVTFNDADVDQQQRYVYDSAGRNTATEHWDNDVFQYKSTTIFGGDRVSIIPPDGGTTTQDVYDARGLVVEKRQYHSANLADSYDATTYAYDRKGQLTSVTDPLGNSWSYNYDMLGRQTKTIDPDAGTSTSTYDNAGQLLTQTDGRGVTLAYAYDSLGRRTAAHEGSTEGPKRAEWGYDTLALGQLTSSTRFEDELAYVSAVTGYNDAYQPTGMSVTIPSSAENGDLAGTYHTSMSYLPNGALESQTLPAAGGLPAETLTHSYRNDGLPYGLTTSGSQGTYVASTAYTYDGLADDMFLGQPGKRTRVSNGYDLHTRQLNLIYANTEKPEGGFTRWRYTEQLAHDQVGNIIKALHWQDGAFDQAECYRYDHHRRLAEAWTDPDTGSWPACTTSQHGGSTDPYWRQWTFDAIGNRLTQTDKNPVAGDTTWIYQAGAEHGVKAHQLASVTASGPLAQTGTRTFTYDAAGNMLTRTTSTGEQQSLTWNAEGRLDTLTEDGADTSYVYDADGSRLISRTPAKTTLYLGGTELELTHSGGQVLGTRYYQHNGNTIAVRTVAGLSWTIRNHQGTSTIQIDAVTLDGVRRRMLPYGETRGTSPASWTGTRGYVGGTSDDTGLTHLGAREYDPSLGRFVSVDPIMDLTDPQQWHAYAYSNNSPVTFSDPSGLVMEEHGGVVSTPKPKPPPCNGNPACKPPTPPGQGDPVCAACNVGGPPPAAEVTLPDSYYENLARKQAERDAAAAAERAKQEEERARQEAIEQAANGRNQAARNIGDIANLISSALGFIPGFICAICAGAAAIFGAIAFIAYLIAGMAAEAFAVLVGVVAGFFAGGVGRMATKAIVAKFGGQMLHRLKHFDPSSVTKFIPTRLRKRVDWVVTGVTGFLSKAIGDFTGNVAADINQHGGVTHQTCEVWDGSCVRPT